MNIFKQIIEKLKSNGDVKSFYLKNDDEDDNKIDWEALVNPKTIKDVQDWDKLFNDANPPGNKMSVFTTNIVNTPDLLKSYLFQNIFIFSDPTLNETIAKDLMFRAKSIKLLPIGRHNKYDSETNSYDLSIRDGTINILFDEFQDLKGYEFWFKHMKELKSFAIDVKLYSSDLKEVIKTFRYVCSGVAGLSSLDFNVEGSGKVQYIVSFVPQKLQIID